jgi:hypothetical protein
MDASPIGYPAMHHLVVAPLLTAVRATEVRNRTRVKRFGIVVAHFTESIRKLD